MEGCIVMTESPYQKLTQLLNNSDQPEWKRSAQALALSFAWNRETIGSTVTSRADLISALSELANALVEVSKSSQGFEALIDKANPGPTLREILVSEQTALSQRAIEVKTLQNEVENLEKLERDNSALIDKQSELQARHQKLANLESFNPTVIDSLRIQIEAMEAAKPWLLELEKYLNNLQEGLPQFAKLSGEALMVLQEKDRQEINKVQKDLNDIQAEAKQKSIVLEQTNKNILAIKEDIATRQKRYAEAEGQLHQVKEVLDQYIKVDREMAMAINNPEVKEARQLLDEIETRMQGVDAALRIAIEANQKAQQIETKIVPL